MQLDLNWRFCNTGSPENQEHLKICDGTEKGSEYVKIARNLNLLEKGDNEFNGRNSEEKRTK